MLLVGNEVQLVYPVKLLFGSMWNNCDADSFLKCGKKERIILTSVFRVLVINLAKESFYKKRKEKTINILRFFLKWIIN